MPVPSFFFPLVTRPGPPPSPLYFPEVTVCDARIATRNPEKTKDKGYESTADGWAEELRPGEVRSTPIRRSSRAHSRALKDGAQRAWEDDSPDAQTPKIPGRSDLSMLLSLFFFLGNIGGGWCWGGRLVSDTCRWWILVCRWDEWDWLVESIGFFPFKTIRCAT